MWKKRNHFVCFPRALLHHATGRRYRPSVHGPRKAVLSCRPNSNGGTFHFGAHSCFIDNVFPCHRLCVRTIAKSKAVVGYTTANEKKNGNKSSSTALRAVHPFSSPTKRHSTVAKARTECCPFFPVLKVCACAKKCPVRSIHFAPSLPARHPRKAMEHSFLNTILKLSATS